MSSKPLTIAANRPYTPGEQRLVDILLSISTVEDALGEDAHGVCTLARIGKDHTITFYEDDMSPTDIAGIAMHILFDAVERFITDNFQTFMDAYESGEFDPEDETEEGYDE